MKPGIPTKTPHRLPPISENVLLVKSVDTALAKGEGGEWSYRFEVEKGWGRGINKHLSTAGIVGSLNT